MDGDIPEQAASDQCNRGSTAFFSEESWHILHLYGVLAPIASEARTHTQLSVTGH